MIKLANQETIDPSNEREAEPPDPQKKLQTLLHWAVRDAQSRLKMHSNSELAAHLGVSDSTFSKMVQARVPIDCERMVERLEALAVSPNVIRACVMLAVATNAKGTKHATYLTKNAEWVLSPERVLADSNSPLNVVLNGLRDNGVQFDPKILKDFESFATNERMKLTSPHAAAEMVAAFREREAAQLTQAFAEQLDKTTIGTVYNWFNRYSKIVCVDFDEIEPKSNKTVSKQVIKTNMVDFARLVIQPNQKFFDTAHPGIHFILMIGGSGEFAQWPKSTLGKQRSFNNSIKLSADVLRFLMFDASSGAHAVKAGPDGAEVLALLLKPRLCPELPEPIRELGLDSCDRSFQTYDRGVTL